MASAFGHALASFTLSRFLPKTLMRKSVVILGIASSIIPDLDILAFKFGIPYDHVFGHRGITHSIFFAVIWALGLIWIVHRKESKRNRRKLFLFYFLATVSHSLLDALTTGGLGVAFFAPFENGRYFFPWRFIQVSPLDIETFFSEWGIKVLISEFKYIGIPCIIFYLIGRIVKFKF